MTRRSPCCSGSSLQPLYSAAFCYFRLHSDTPKIFRSRIRGRSGTGVITSRFEAISRPHKREPSSVYTGTRRGMTFNSLPPIMNRTIAAPRARAGRKRTARGRRHSNDAFNNQYPHLIPQFRNLHADTEEYTEMTTSHGVAPVSRSSPTTPHQRTLGVPR